MLFLVHLERSGRGRIDGAHGQRRRVVDVRAQDPVGKRERATRGSLARERRDARRADEAVQRVRQIVQAGERFLEGGDRRACDVEGDHSGSCRARGGGGPTSPPGSSSCTGCTARASRWAGTARRGRCSARCRPSRGSGSAAACSPPRARRGGSPPRLSRRTPRSAATASGWCAGPSRGAWRPVGPLAPTAVAVVVAASALCARNTPEAPAISTTAAAASTAVPTAAARIGRLDPSHVEPIPSSSVSPEAHDRPSMLVTARRSSRQIPCMGNDRPRRGSAAARAARREQQALRPRAGSPRRRSGGESPTTP